MNDWTAGLRVRFLKNTISAEIRGPVDVSGKTLKAARCPLNDATDAGRMPTNSPLAISDTVSCMAMVLRSGFGGEKPLARNTSATNAPGALS
jgi:hypothetical protein